MVNTWQHLWYVTRAAHHMTEVIADLEIELRKREEEIKELVDPGNPPPPPTEERPCIPPWQCRMDVADLHKYSNDLRAYVDKVMERTANHIAEARERGVTEFLYRVVETPERPK
jgi:hypothetical protein